MQIAINDFLTGELRRNNAFFGAETELRPFGDVDLP